MNSSLNYRSNGIHKNMPKNLNVLKYFIYTIKQQTSNIDESFKYGVNDYLMLSDKIDCICQHC